MKCDVIIPTWNSAKVLPHTLQALAEQELPAEGQVRIIVSDDGSTDDTVLVAESFSLPPGWQKKILCGSHGGAGAARNRALKKVQADIELFLDADILLRPGALAAHFLFHEHKPDPAAAALGIVRWDPRLSPSPLMEWMEHGGQQNAFDEILGQTEANPRTHWYGSHLSLKSALAARLKFPEDFTGYGWEDLSVGYQAADQKVKLYVLSTAVGLHYHFHTPADFARRRYAAGLNISRLQAQHPAVSVVPKRSWLNHLRRGIFVAFGGQAVLAWCMVFWGRYYSLPRVFLLFTTNEFWKGVWRSRGGFFAYLRQYV